mmetsp:Transcript_68532/g.153853  ORF Transcript_68532/g.153853 Transcript_68532/m.153853 type:complete len:221 (+) Transcript_68532:1260-1922(+)
MQLISLAISLGRSSPALAAILRQPLPHRRRKRQPPRKRRLGPLPASTCWATATPPAERPAGPVPPFAAERQSLGQEVRSQGGRPRQVISLLGSWSSQSTEEVGTLRMCCGWVAQSATSPGCGPQVRFGATRRECHATSAPQEQTRRCTAKTCSWHNKCAWRSATVAPRGPAARQKSSHRRQRRGASWQELVRWRHQVPVSARWTCLVDTSRHPTNLFSLA